MASALSSCLRKSPGQKPSLDFWAGTGNAATKRFCDGFQSTKGVSQPGGTPAGFRPDAVLPANPAIRHQPGRGQRRSRRRDVDPLDVDAGDLADPRAQAGRSASAPGSPTPARGPRPASGPRRASTGCTWSGHRVTRRSRPSVRTHHRPQPRRRCPAPAPALQRTHDAVERIAHRAWFCRPMSSPFGQCRTIRGGVSSGSAIARFQGDNRPETDLNLPVGCLATDPGVLFSFEVDIAPNPTRSAAALGRSATRRH